MEWEAGEGLVSVGAGEGLSGGDYSDLFLLNLRDERFYWRCGMGARRRLRFFEHPCRCSQNDGVVMVRNDRVCEAWRLGGEHRRFEPPFVPQEAG